MSCCSKPLQNRLSGRTIGTDNYNPLLWTPDYMRWWPTYCLQVALNEPHQVDRLNYITALTVLSRKPSSTSHMAKTVAFYFKNEA